MKEIRLNEGLITIKKSAFAQCTAMKSVIIPETVETIEVIAFGAMAEDFKIIGKSGSAAETYANSASIAFEAKP